MQLAQGSLAIVDGDKVFWKGEAVPGIVSVKLNYEDGDTQVKLKVNGTADALYMDMVSAGIFIKKVRA